MGTLKRLAYWALVAFIGLVVFVSMYIGAWGAEP